jgi:hypothetical protein
LFHDFGCTPTQTRVSAAAVFDQISVAVATANQNSFMTGLPSSASPLVQTMCHARVPPPPRRVRDAAHPSADDPGEPLRAGVRN